MIILGMICLSSCAYSITHIHPSQPSDALIENQTKKEI